MEGIRRIGVFSKVGDNIFEGEQDSRVYFEGQVKIEWASTSFFGVQIHLPHLAKRISLNEMSLVVDVEAVVDSMIFEICNISGNIDDSHGSPGYSPRRTEII